MGDGGNTCPDTPKMTLRVRWKRLRWFTYGVIKYRLQLQTGYFAVAKTISPSPEKRRPRGIWFWTRQYYANIVGSFSYRLKWMTGWYEYQNQITMKELHLRAKKGVIIGG